VRPKRIKFQDEMDWELSRSSLGEPVSVKNYFSLTMTGKTRHKEGKRWGGLVVWTLFDLKGVHRGSANGTDSVRLICYQRNNQKGGGEKKNFIRASISKEKKSPYYAVF